MGLLTLDITPVGLVMTSDSQAILLHEESFEVLPERGDRKKIVRARLSGFRGLLRYVGTESLGDKLVSEWLQSFVLRNQELALADFSAALADSLSAEWRRKELDTCLWVFIAGYENGEACFWFVVNGFLDPSTGLYEHIDQTFFAVNDLDESYIAPRRASDPRLTKQEILTKTVFRFRNGVLVPPTTEIVDAFDVLSDRLHTGRYKGFVALRSLDHFAYIARQRMEFIKRLYSSKHGIYVEKNSPISGTVYVHSVASDGTFWNYPLKGRAIELR
jgi:hypothetical protein